MTIDEVRDRLNQRKKRREEQVTAYRQTQIPTQAPQTTNSWQNVQNRLNQPSKLEQARVQQRNTFVQPSQSTQPITKSQEMQEIKMPTRADNAKYVGKKTGAGVLSGVTGIAESYITDTANQLKQGEKKDTAQAVSNLTNKLLSSNQKNVVTAGIDTIKENIDILSDKDKNIWEKIAGVGLNSTSDAVNALPFKQKTNAVIQTIGSVLKGNNTSDKVVDIAKAVNKPSEIVNEQLAKEGQQYGKATQFIGDAMQSVGNMMPSIATSYLTGSPDASLFTMGLSAKGNATMEALNRGQELEDAIKRGDTDMMIETGTEMLSGGVNIFGKGVVDDIVDSNIKKIKNNVVRYLAKQGFDFTGEITEEVISDVLGTILDKGTVDPNASYDIVKDGGKTVITTILSTLALKALTGGLYGDAVQINNDNLIQDSNLTEEEKENLSDFAEKNQLNSEQIKRAIEITNEARNQQATTQNKPILPQAEQTTQEQVKVAQNETSQEIRQDEELSEKTGQIVTNLMRSIDNYNNTRQEGEKVFDINDENTRKEIESIQKIAQDRGINITFDESRFDNSTDNAFYEYDDNGNVANIVLNPNSASKKYVQNLAVHELVHSFSGDKKSNLMNSVLDYAKTLEGYNKAYQDITNAYKSKYGNNVSTDIINEEVVANILGEKLGDKQFVNDMINGKYATQNRGFVEKIYEFVKNQINRFRGYKDQEQYWKHVKELFDDAYKNSEINKGQSYSREATAMTNIKDSQGRNLSEGQVEYFKDSKVRDKNGNLLEVYHGTPTRRIYNL